MSRRNRADRPRAGLHPPRARRQPSPGPARLTGPRADPGTHSRHRSRTGRTGRRPGQVTRLPSCPASSRMDRRVEEDAPAPRRRGILIPRPGALLTDRRRRSVASVRPQGRRGRQAHRYRHHRHLPRHDRQRGQRPGPVLHSAAGQPLGRVSRWPPRPGSEAPGHAEPLGSRRRSYRPWCSAAGFSRSSGTRPVRYSGLSPWLRDVVMTMRLRNSRRLSRAHA